VESRWTAASERRAASEQGAGTTAQQTDSALNGSEKRAAAREGVSRGVELAQLQGVDVTQAQIQAARDSAGAAANQSQAANVSQIQAAAAGATHAALVQSQNVSVEQFQAAVGGATGGSLTQTQNVSVTQLQSASFGAVHGALAEKRRGDARDVRAACEGAAAGAAQSAAASGVKAVPVVQEAAQGSAYGAITQRQNVSVEQRQAAAFGAARGVLESDGNVSVAQRQSVDVKKVQVAALGAAKGALIQSQRATVEQIQAAGRGAAKGAISQAQRVTVEQIQAAAAGAASGGISQYQSVSVTQIQAAATGGARGALVQSQSVNVVQIQKAASGGASGAARGAAGSQVVNVEQIQAAASGAAEGGIVQIQVVNIIQIQIIAGSAAEGAVSQSQVANVVQIQNAARGASRGGVGLTQIQTVSITQLQVSVTQSASAAAESAANEGVTDGDEIANGAQEDVEEDVAPQRPDLESLDVTVDCESLSVENPNDQRVSVTRVAENGSVVNVTVPAGETRDIPVTAMSYALRAETDNGTVVRVDGLVTFVVDIDRCPPPASESLDVTVEERNITVENPNDAAVDLTVENASGVVFEGSIPAGEDRVVGPLEPGEYDLSAERDGEVVLVEGEEIYTVTIQAEDGDGDGPGDGDGVDTELSSCTVIDEPGRYVLTDDIEAEVPESGACIEIQSSDVALDGQGYALTRLSGGNASGVAVEGEGADTQSNVTVANLRVVDFSVGIEARDAEEGAVRNVTVAGTPPEDDQTGIDFSQVTEFTVANSSVQGSGAVRTTGIGATQSWNVTVAENDVTPAGGSAIQLTLARNAEVTGNDVSDGDTGIGVYIVGGNRVANNTVTGFDVGIVLSEAKGNDLADNRIESSGQGVVLRGVSDGNSFAGTQITNADTGFNVVDSTDIVVENATVDGTDTAVSLTGKGYIADPPTTYPSGVRLVDVEVTDAATAIYADNGSTAVAEGLTIGPVTGITLDATNVSVAGSRGVTGEVPGTDDLPAFPDGVMPAVFADSESAPFVGIAGTDPNASASLTLPYDDGALPEDVEESALRLWRSNGTTDGAWTLVAGSSVDTDGDIVTGEFTPESGVERAYGPAAGAEAPPDFASLSVAVERRNVTVENPNDVSVTLTVENASGVVFEGSVPADGDRTIGPLEPGEYDLSAEREGEVVLVEGEEVYTVTIRAEDGDGDGVDTELSSCTVIDDPGEYVLTEDVTATDTGPCLDVRASDVVLDGQGFAVQSGANGADSTGVALATDLANVTVVNVTVSGFGTGVDFADVEGGEVRNLTASDVGTGVSFGRVSTLLVTDSTIRGREGNDSTGIAGGGSNATIQRNVLRNAGISLGLAGDFEVVDNDVSGGDTGISLDMSTGRIADNEIEETDTGILVLGDSINNVFDGNRIRNSTGSAVRLAGLAFDNRFVDTRIVDAPVGFEITDSADNVVENATISDVETAVSLYSVATGPLAEESDTRLTDVAVSGATTAVNASDGATVVAERLDIGPVAGVSFTGTNVSIAGSQGTTGQVPGTGDLPAFPDGVTPVVDADSESAPFVGIIGTDEDPRVDLELPYDDAALPAEVNESALRLWRSNGTTDGAWTLVAGSSVDTDGNVVTGEFAPESGVERAYGPAARTEAEPVAFENLSVAVEGPNVTVENPNDVAVNLTVTNESGGVTNASVPASGNVTIGPLAPGNYTLTAMADGRTVPIEGEDSYAFTIAAPEPEPELDSLRVETMDVCAVPVADGGATRQLSVNVTNPNDQSVALVGFVEGEQRTVTTVPAGNQTVDLPPEAGNWTFRAYVPADEAAETDFDEPGPYPNLTAVPVNDAESVPVTVELCAIDLGVSQADGNVTVTNDEPIDATVFARNDTLQTVPVPAGESVVLDSLAPDEYTLTAEAIDGGPATLDGETSLNVTIEVVGTPTPTATPNETVTPNETATPTPNETTVPTPTETPTDTPTDTPTETPTDTPTETPTDTPTETPTDTPTETPTDTPTETPTATPAAPGTQTTAPASFGVGASGDPGVVHAATELVSSLVESVGGLLDGAGDAMTGVLGGFTPTSDALDAVVAERVVLGYEATTAWIS